MTEAPAGLRKALARAGSSVVSIAEMQTEDLLAEMSDEQKAALAAQIAPAAASDDAGMKPKKNGADEHGADEHGEDDEGEDGAAPGSEAAAVPLNSNASVHERVKAVAAAVESDDTCKGKAALALSLLADDDYAGLSASGIVKLLGKSGVGAAAAGDPDQSARAAMLAALSETTNSDIDADAPGKASSAARAASIWDSAISKL